MKFVCHKAKIIEFFFILHFSQKKHTVRQQYAYISYSFYHKQNFQA